MTKETRTETAINKNEKNMKKNICDYRDIGEGMILIEDQGYTIINTETGMSRQFVDRMGFLNVDDDEIDIDAISDSCPHYHLNEKYVQYRFGRYDNFRNGVCAICWTVYPEGRYFEDEDGFGDEGNEEERVYCIINRDLEIIVPFRPIRDVHYCDDVRQALNKYRK